MSRAMERRILSVWFPHLPIERWAKESDSAPESPVVLTIEGTHGPIIHAVTRAAAERGARAGTRLTDARAVDPSLIAVAADTQGDGALLQRLARWAGRWSPLVEVDGADAPSTGLGTGLRLDVTGAAHLFGGEAGLLADVRERFEAIGLTCRVAIAPTPGAAWALARFPSPRSASPSRPLPQGERDLAAALAPLPVAALRLSPQATRTLERLGLKTIGALAGIERRSLARRFREADNPVDALDRMLGRKPDPLTAAPFAPPPRATMRLEEPVADPAAAPRALELLVPRLVRVLEQRKLGARQLALTGFRVDGSTALASVATSIPSREPAHLMRLLAERAAALDPGFGFDGFALEASWAEPLGAAQQSLVEEPPGERDVARLVDRLSVKLGASKVRRPERHESHLPERRSGWVAGVDSTPLPQAGGGAETPAPPRPARRHRGHLCHPRRGAAAVRVAAVGA
ncbi:MAG: DNA polymerase Y family protein [Pseudomonadota bacterium]|nr:DNA polymerase Y family protein [Pseudomonadota bacterium]